MPSAHRKSSAIVSFDKETLFHHAHSEPNRPASSWSEISPLRSNVEELALPIKRRKVEDVTKWTSEAHEIEEELPSKTQPLTLWNLSFTIDARDYNTEPGFLDEFGPVAILVRHPLSKRTGHEIFISIHLVGQRHDHNPFLILDQSALDLRSKSLLACAGALTSQSSTLQKSLRDVYSNIQCDHHFQIRGSQFLITLKATVTPLYRSSSTSMRLASNILFKTLINEQYPESNYNPATVTAFYNVLRPPPMVKQWPHVDGLKTELMQYQKNAVDWMLNRELGASEQPNLWIPYTDTRNRITYLQKDLALIASGVEDLYRHRSPILGGILSDEMGLGKTLEVITTIMRNRRRLFSADHKFDSFTGNNVRPIGSTLIVTPMPILEQWLDEVKKHSNLKAHYYRGLKKDASNLDLAEFDIVITSYTVLAAEVHHAAPTRTDRSLRNPPQYARRKSPLAEYEWWRVIMDEAQMIQTGTSSAAQVACLIPRVLAWIVTGTPISKSCGDLYGLLHFLRLDPIYAQQALWNKIIAGGNGANHVAGIFEPLSCRNTKLLVSQEMSLPPQTKFLCTTNLTALEEQNFRDLLLFAFNDIGLDLQGNPFAGKTWSDIDTGRIGTWVTQLRQACSHPQIGTRNRNILNAWTKPILSLDEVLETMTKNTEHELDVAQRSLCSGIIEKGRILEYRTECQSALEIWLKVLPMILEKVQITQDKSHDTYRDSVLAEHRQEEEQFASSAIDLRSWNEVLHKCYFFLGSIYFQLDQPLLEKEYYAKAKDIRRNLLGETEQVAAVKVTSLKQAAHSQSFATIPEIKFPALSGGFQTREILERLQTLTELMNTQANQLDEYRELCIQRLCTELADQNDDPSGEEYQQSLDSQAEAFAYHELVRFMLADRNQFVHGTKNRLTEDDARKAALGTEDDSASEILRAGMKVRASLVPLSSLGSLNSIKLELRHKIRQIEDNLLSSKQKTSMNLELDIANRVLKQVDKDLDMQRQCLIPLGKEVELLSSIYNAKLEYYRQFQTISDSVEAFTVLRLRKAETIYSRLDDQLSRATGHEKIYEVDESDISEEERTRRIQHAMDHVENELLRLSKVIDQGTTRLRYMRFLDSQKNNVESEVCTICTSVIEIGAFTRCGHIFCRECFRMWFREHRACPICKTVLKNRDAFQTITLTGKTKLEARDNAKIRNGETFQDATITNHYDILDPTTKQWIHGRRLVRSYSCKVDAIVKHILSLPAGSKSILYSNWNDVLLAFRTALSENHVMSAQLGNVGPKSLGDRTGTLSDFTNDPACAVLLMSGKSQSAGLTLINATNLFLVEPLLNPAVEAQVVSRIHRIGQTQATNVFQFAVNGTLEMSILEQSCRRKSQVSAASTARPDSGDGGDAREETETVPLVTADQPNLEEAIRLLQSNYAILSNKEAVLDAQDTLLGVI